MIPSIEYELLTKEIYQTLLNAEDIKTIDVRHNVKVKGKAFEHQIDVYWEYEIAGIKHKVAIECKNYNKEVPVGKVRDFYGVLADIGNVSGIIVTKIGFQKGAKEYAQHYGINLKELREPTDIDWNGRIRSIDFRIQILSPVVKKRHVDLDAVWIAQNVKSGNGYKVNLKGMSDEIWITDIYGEKLKDFTQLDQELPNNFKEENNLTHYYEFKDAFIEGVNFEKLKIRGIRYEYDVALGSQEVVIRAEAAAKAILKDALDGKIIFFDETGLVY